MESKVMVSNVLQNEKKEKEQEDKLAALDMPNDTDGEDEEEEYKQWEIREMKRILRYWIFIFELVGNGR